MMDSLINYDQQQSEDNDNETDMTQFMIAITIVPTMNQRNTPKHKRLQTNVPTFKGQKKRYSEIEFLLLNRMQPFQNKITEKEKIQFILSLLR